MSLTQVHVNLTTCKNSLKSHRFTNSKGILFGDQRYKINSIRWTLHSAAALNKGAGKTSSTGRSYRFGRRSGKDGAKEHLRSATALNKGAGKTSSFRNSQHSRECRSNESRLPLQTKKWKAVPPQGNSTPTGTLDTSTRPVGLGHKSGKDIVIGQSHSNMKVAEMVYNEPLHFMISVHKWILNILS